MNELTSNITKFSALLIVSIWMGTDTLVAEGYPETGPNDPRKVRSISSPNWLQAFARSMMETGKKSRNLVRGL